MTTCVYARVSSETQEKHQTIDSQLAELRRYAEAHDLAIASEFVDDGYSTAAPSTASSPCRSRILPDCVQAIETAAPPG